MSGKNQFHKYDGKNSQSERRWLGGKKHCQQSVISLYSEQSMSRFNQAAVWICVVEKWISASSI